MIDRKYFSSSSAVSIFLVLYIFCTGCIQPIIAEERDLATLSLEELSEVKISTVSMREESLRNSAAAVHVITANDISRSNAQSIPELLRTVPGLHVARIDSSNWAISSRGSNGLFNNRMLVLIDGRSVYSPIFGGVFWQVQDTPLEDIERIEVILGPGASTWGANAVNGVINIITKNSANTLGSMFSTSLSNEGQTATSRYGLKIDDNANFRAYARGRFGENFERNTGGESYDGYGLGQIGYRYDRRDGKDLITSQGDWYAGNIRLAVLDVNTPDFMEVSDVSDVAGGNILNRFTRDYSDGGKLQAQIFYDKTQRYDPVALNSASTYDTTLQYNAAQIGSHNFTFGMGYRYVQTSLRPNRLVSTVDPDNSLHSANSFIQDQISLLDDVKLTIGTKFDHQEYVGGQWQPTARLAWELDRKNSLWTSFSRAARVPTLADNSVMISSPIPIEGGMFFPGQLIPSKKEDSEYLNSYEAGFRSKVTDMVTVDVAAYFNKYSNFTNYVVAGGPAVSSTNPTNPFIPIRNTNDGEIDSYGVELSSTVKIADNLDLKGWYTNLRSDSQNQNTPTVGSLVRNDGLSPSNQAYLRLEWDITDRYSFSPSLRYVDSVPEFSVPAYLAGGFKFSYRPQQKVELAVGAENLFAPKHVEYQSDFILLPRSEIPTFGYVSLKLEF